ncbi:uncharacterized protein LOC132742786 [Ruditapes philippinarum]|uniref:uncharacterized protein LOC132742786 n=1 Tax=Ruditapes philippinarum TaxID=129788 RepID=UPI00295AC564|nr:uncharacterized protein LOC132742786 [Ruditapes philippinarum]
MDIDRERITSKLLSHILDKNGLNKYASELSERNMHMKEFTETFLCGSYNMASGGSAEGTKIQGGDADLMGILKGVEALEIHKYIPKFGIELLIERDGCSPGYVKLVCRKFDMLDLSVNIPNGTLGRQFVSMLPELETKFGNETYISSTQFKKFIHWNEYIFPDKFTDTAITISGHHVKVKTLLGEVDYVTAIECGSWPKCAHEWLNRSRKYQWPSKEFLQSLQDKCKCYVVPTGDDSSPIADIQWRLSFVTIERELVWQMNDIQLKCFIILKILMKNDTPALPNNTLKTYHLKNAMFWLVEETPAEQWSAHLLHARVIECLEKIIQYVRNKCLPHYILPENNLFRNRFMTSAETKDTITCLENMQGNVLKIVRDMYASSENIFNDQRVFDYFNNDIRNLIIVISLRCSSSHIINYKEKFCQKFAKESKLVVEGINVAISKAMYIESTNNKSKIRGVSEEIKLYLCTTLKTTALSYLYRALFEFHSRNYTTVITLIKVIASKMKEYGSHLQDVRFTNADNAYLPDFLILEQNIKGNMCVTRMIQLTLSLLLMFLSNYHLRNIQTCHHCRIQGSIRF